MPLGVVAIIYESRPNVTSDAAALALKSGNACMLRGGKEAFRAARTAIAACPAAARCGMRVWNAGSWCVLGAGYHAATVRHELMTRCRAISTC